MWNSLFLGDLYDSIGMRESGIMIPAIKYKAVHPATAVLIFILVLIVVLFSAKGVIGGSPATLIIKSRVDARPWTTDSAIYPLKGQKSNLEDRRHSRRNSKMVPDRSRYLENLRKLQPSLGERSVLKLIDLQRSTIPRKNWQHGGDAGKLNRFPKTLRTPLEVRRRNLWERRARQARNPSPVTKM